MISILKAALVMLVFSREIFCYRKDGKCYKSVDLLIALDVSGSIEPSSWQSEIDLSKEIIRSLSIPDSGNQFAVMDFSTDQNVVANLGTNSSKAIRALDGLKSNFKDGHSFIDLALHEASNILSSKKSSNPMKALVIITDGYMTLKNGKDDTYYLSPAKNRLTAAKVEVFAIGIGKYNENALKLIASNPSHVFKISDGKSMLEQLQKSTETPCFGGNDDSTGRAEPEPLKCGKVLFQRIGCYRDKQAKPRPLPNLIMTDRDTTSRVSSGKTINWKQWETYLPDLVCRCAKESHKKEMAVFGLQYYGECWANSKTDTFNKDGPAESKSSCITIGYKPCAETAEYCVGKNEHNFVYRIVGEAAKT